MRRIVILAALALAALGCDKKPDDQQKAAATDNAPQTASSAPAATTGGTTTADPAPDEPNYAAFAPEQWCPAAYADTVKIVEAMKATMKHAGKTAAQEDDYAPPAEGRYLELCGKLPAEMQKCLVVGYAARNREACQTALEAMDDPAKAAYGELMGK